MNMLLIFFNIIISLHISVAVKNSSSSVDKLFRIIGGTDTNVIEAPYVLQLLKNAVFRSSATLVSPTKAVTSAQMALDSDSFTMYEVVAGNSEKYNYYTELFERPIPVVLYFHPDYCAFNCSNPSVLTEHDIAVVILSKPLEYSIEIQPIKLPKRGDKVPVGQMATIFGWGNTHPDIDIASDYLKSAQVEVIDENECNERYSITGISVTNNMICAGIEPRIDTCRWDNGGPLVVNNVLYGIISSGYPECGDERFPGIYTNVINYIDFIESEYEKNDLNVPIPDGSEKTI